MEIDFDTLRNAVEKSSKLDPAELERRLMLYSERAGNNLDIFTGEKHGFGLDE